MESVRERLLSGLPVNDRRMPLAGTSTAVLEGGDGPLELDRLLTWLDELIGQTCALPPVLVGKGPGGALDRFRTPCVKAAMRSLMKQLAPPMPRLARSTVPTTLIWGRHDAGVRLGVAEAASERYGWPLHVIEDARDDPAVEQPNAFLRALRAA